MLRAYEISNFKAFAGDQRVPLRPITLIYGQNSSGKSSLLQSLLMLKQTIESVENPEMLLFPKGSLVDLGGYREFINAHDIKKPFAFQMIFPASDLVAALPGPITTALNKSQASNVGMRIELIWDAETAAVKLNTLQLFVGDASTPLFTCKSERKKTGARFARRFPFFAQGSSAAVSDSVLRICHINSDHSFWPHLWEATRAQLEHHTLRDIQRRRELLSKRLERIRPPELQDIEEAERPTEIRLEREVKEIDALLAKIAEYSLKDALSDIEKAGSRTLILCRNFLPVGLIREEGYEARTVTTISEYIGPGYIGDFASLPSLVVAAARSVQSFLERMIYIGPLRDYPERHYIFSGNLAEHVGKSGKMVPDVLFKRTDLLAQVNEQLESFGLGYELKVSSVNDRDSEFAGRFCSPLVRQAHADSREHLGCGFWYQPGAPRHRSKYAQSKQNTLYRTT